MTAKKRPRQPTKSKATLRSEAPQVEPSEVPAAAATSQVGRNSLPIVGLVASAGGLDAFKKFFSAMPSDSGVGFVVIPHLDPMHESLMVELLARQTSMPVAEATEGVAVEANHVYILPPNKYMTIVEGRLRLTGPVERQGLQTSIDLFLRALADDQMEKAICIIMSGTGSHGALGLKAIKAAGGMALVQDPASSDHPRMPQSAIATGLADYVLPPEQMPEALVKYVHHFYGAGGATPLPVVEGSDQLHQLLVLLRTRTQFDFRSYRKKMLERRVQRRMGLCHFQDMADYLAHLREHPDELNQLVRDLLISVTTFFRDPEALAVLAKEALAPLLAAKPTGAPVRIWVPSCASGEEAYSLAILAFEQIAAAEKPHALQIFATDVSAHALEAARQGVYPESIAADVSPERLERFFTKLDGSAYKINKQVREVVVFAEQNLIADAPFSKVDLVSCRNFLIYLDPEAQKKIIGLFHFALNDHGYLFLGSSETIGRQTDLFEPISKKWRLFRRIGPARPETIDVPIAKGKKPGQVLRTLQAATQRPLNFADLTQRLLLEEIGSAAVLVNRDSEVVFFQGAVARFLDVSAGEPTHDLLRLAPDTLRTKLRRALHQAIHEGQTVQLADIAIRRHGVDAPIRVIVRPVQNPKTAAGHCLVVFQDAASTAAPSKYPAPAATEEPLVRELEYELRATKEDLQSTIEELESSNEELKASNEEVMSMNEELQAANEELETSKEELQSLNEELSTVNNQLQDKVEELEATNNDMVNLLNCTDVATLFLDTQFRIRRYTVATTVLVNLIASDIGRPMSDIALKFTDIRLLPDAEQVLRDLTPREREVQTDDGRWWLRRITPYRTLDNRIEGVVVTFVHVSAIKKADQQARLLATVLKDSNDAVTVHDFTGRITLWNRGAERLYGYSEAEALLMNIQRLIPDELQAGDVARWERLGRGERLDSLDVPRLTKDGRALNLWITATLLTDETGRPIAIAATHRDITELKKARVHLEHEVERRTAALRDQQSRLQAVMNSPDDAIITIDRRGAIESVNTATTRLFGYSAAELIGKNVNILMPEPDQKKHDDYLSEYLRTGIKKIIGIGREILAQRRDGSCFHADLAVSEVAEQKLFIGVLRDITRRKELEQEIIEISVLEQQRIGQDLHDECGQELTALGLLADSLEGAVETKAPDNVGTVRKLAHGIRQVLRQVRNISRGLAVAPVEPSGLAATLAELTGRLSETSGVRCSASCDANVAVDNSVQATHLFHIAQEACTNALKHGRARNIEIRLRSADHAMILEIQDDGDGIAMDAREGLGQRIMRNRASIMGARLTIAPASPHGTLVTCALGKESSGGQEK